MAIKKITIFLFSFIVLNLNAQDEYEEPTITIETEEPLYESTDSIKVVNESDNSIENIRKKKKDGEMSEFRKNFRIGGTFNLSSFYYSTSGYEGQLLAIGLSPQFTYVLSDYFEGGLSTSYQYIGSFGDVNIHTYSIGPIMRAYPFETMFLQVEGMFERNEVIFKGYSVPENNINAFVGGGLMQRFSDRAYAITGIKVNLMKTQGTLDQYIPIIFSSIHFGI